MNRDILLVDIFAVFMVIVCVSLVVLAGFFSYSSLKQTNAYKNLCQKIDIAVLGDNDIDNNDILEIKRILKEYKEL